MSELEFEIELTGRWSARHLRALADVVDLVERIPPEKRQEAMDTAMRLVAVDKNKSAIRLVVDNG